MSSDSRTASRSLKIVGWVCGLLGILVVPWALAGLLLGATLMPSIQALSNDTAPPPLGSGGVTGVMVAWFAVECLVGLLFAVFGFALAAGREWGRRGLLSYLCLGGGLGALALAGTGVSLLSTRESTALFAALPLLGCAAVLGLLYLAFRWLSSLGVRAACSRPALAPAAPPPP
jgi:hypothetical protein